MSPPSPVPSKLQSEPRVLLASASPRRRELLSLLGVRFTVVVSRFPEESLAHVREPLEYVRDAALGKAMEVATRRRDGIVLGVDTDVVAPDSGPILGKPKDADDAFRMLKLLSGATHQVHTAVVLLEARAGEIGRQEVRIVSSDVTFGAVPDTALHAYVATGEPMDKAGAYAIQGRAMAFVSEIRGDLSAIIGLPLTTTAEMLRNFGVPLYQFADANSELKEARP